MLGRIPRQGARALGFLLGSGELLPWGADAPKDSSNIIT